MFVTHNVREAACLGNRVILFSSHPGRIREEFKIDLERPRRHCVLQFSLDRHKIERLNAAKMSASFSRRFEKPRDIRGGFYEAGFLRLATNACTDARGISLVKVMRFHACAISSADMSLRV